MSRLASPARAPFPVRTDCRASGPALFESLVLGISPAQAFGCLRPERILAHRGVAVQCLLPGVVRRHPQAGRPRDLLLHGREQAPPDFLASLAVTALAPVEHN